MLRRTKARRRFHTDRIVRVRRARLRDEMPGWAPDDPRAWAYGRLADRDPWDCGHPSCGVCHPHDAGRRARERRRWRTDWDV